MVPMDLDSSEFADWKLKYTDTSGEWKECTACKSGDRRSKFC